MYVCLEVRHVHIPVVGTIDGHPYNGGVLNLEAHNREVPLYCYMNFLKHRHIHVHVGTYMYMYMYMYVPMF